MWWDTVGFRLEWHGDHYERQFVPMLASEIYQYQPFWVKYVVPLTNRIDSRFSPLDPEWIMLRSRVPRLLDLFAESSYSAAFYFCRACSLMESPEPMPESVFAVLRMSTFNVYRLLKVCDDLFRALQYPRYDFTHLASASPIWGTIRLYRNLLLKNPVPGRARTIQSNSLPRECVLQKALAEKGKTDKIFTWQEAQELGESDFTRSADLTKQCRVLWARELNRIWLELEKALDPHREDEEFLRYMGLDVNARVPGDTGNVMLYLDCAAPAVSGSK
jgi:hypothetical protein